MGENLQKTIAAVLPAFCPSPLLPEMVRRLLDEVTWAGIYVVDDGSPPNFRHCFDELADIDGVRVCRHKQNHGKAAALKTGFAAALAASPLAAILTADADGQHEIPDIVAMAIAQAEEPGALWTGCREFSRAPWRNRIGNRLAAWAFEKRTGLRIKDTQCGLRIYPATLARILTACDDVSGYEFETAALLAALQNHMNIRELPIATLYGGVIAPSHFRAVRDSWRIGKLLR